MNLAEGQVRVLEDQFLGTPAVRLHVGDQLDRDSHRAAVLAHFDDALDAVAGLDGVQHLGSGDQLAEGGVASVEVGLRGESNEELAASGVGTCQGHTDYSAAVAQAVDLVAYDVARAAVAVASWVSGLDDEVGDYAVE